MGNEADTFAANDKQASLRSSRRNYLVAVAGSIGSVALAGCSSDDVDRPEQGSDTPSEADVSDGGETSDGSPTESSQEPAETPDQSQSRTADAALGDVIEGDQLALAAYDVERTTEVGAFFTADEGNEFVVVELAVKNKASDEFINFSSFLQVTVRDSASTEYDQTITGSENALEGGELAPGEVTRGALVFEVPKDASGLTLHVDLDESLFENDGVAIDLDAQGSGRTLTHDLQVAVQEVGDTLDYQHTHFTVNNVRTSMEEGFASPDEGNEFVIVDITVENTGEYDLTVSTLLQMDLKDAKGRTYSTSLTAMSTLDRSFSEGEPIAPGGQRRGEVAFEAKQELSPLYLVMDFDVFAEGDKSFVRLR